MSSGDKNDSLRKRRKGNRFSLAFGILFGCVSKKNLHVGNIDKEYVSVSCQCLEEKELEENSYHQEEQILLESKEKLDITIYKENEIAPLTEEFRTSLNKLDSLINTLNDIHGIYKNTASFKYLDEECVRPVEDNVGNGECEDEHLKFNINFDKNTFIECHTNRGKHSLKIIHNSAEQNFNPLILHRCESEFLLIKKNHNITHHSIDKSSSKIYQEKSSQLQRSYHTVSSNFGSRILNLDTFKSSLVEHMKHIKDDVENLRHILYNVDYIINKEDKPLLPFSFEEIRKWFLADNKELEFDLPDDKSLLTQNRFVEAKLRASNFCKFYTLGKKLSEKGKWKKHKKNCK